jgi:hypothetical protein
MENQITDNFNLNNKWILWFHKINDNNWNIENYEKVYEISTYYDVLFIIKNIDNITSGMFFLMKENILPNTEDVHNIKGGFWSLRFTKKDSLIYWEKLLYYICVDNITIDKKYQNLINGLSISPKINNCICKIWNSNFNEMKTEYLRKDLDFINWNDVFYLPHFDN